MKDLQRTHSVAEHPAIRPPSAFLLLSSFISKATSFRVLLGLALFLSCAGATLPLGAAVYYVDFATGRDSNSGTSPSSPWKRSPGDAQAGGIVANTALKPGDKIVFKGGVRYNGSIDLNWSGADGAPVIYDGNSGGNWGVGKAIIDNENGEHSTAFVAGGSASHLQIANFEITRIGGYAADDPILLKTCAEEEVTQPRGGTAISFQEGGRNIVLRDLYIHEVGQWRNQQPFSGAHSVTGTGVSLENMANVQILDCEFTRMRAGVSIKARSTTSNITIQGCDFHNYMVWPIDIAPRSAGAIFEDITIRDSKIHDYAEFDSGNWLGCGEKPHTDGIFLRTAGMASIWRNINIFNNEFYVDDRGASKGGTAAIYLSQGPSANIFNNIFRNVVHSRTIFIGHSGPSGANPQVVRIYNNTFFDWGLGVYSSGESDSDRRAVHVVNNLFFATAERANSTPIYFDGVLPAQLDHNLYYSPHFSADEDYVARLNGSWSYFSDLRKRGFETNGVWGDPRFQGGAQPTSAVDFVLSPKSEAVGRGKNLLGDLDVERGLVAAISDVLTENLASDRFGYKRSAAGPWDIGASGFVELLESPTNLRLEP